MQSMVFFGADCYIDDCHINGTHSKLTQISTSSTFFVSLAASIFSSNLLEANFHILSQKSLFDPR